MSLLWKPSLLQGLHSVSSVPASPAPAAPPSAPFLGGGDLSSRRLERAIEARRARFSLERRLGAGGADVVIAWKSPKFRIVSNPPLSGLHLCNLACAKKNWL